MPDAQSPITIHDEGERTLVRINETELTAFNVQPIADAMDTLIKQRRGRTLVIDLADVLYLPSAGIAILIEAQRKVREQGGRLILAGAAEKVLGMFQLTGLAEVFEFEGDAGSA